MRQRLDFAAALALACALALLPGPARANSVFSVGGLGEPQNPEPARLRALGGAGVAEQGSRAFSLVNPASTADVERLVFEGTILPAWRRVDAVSEPDETASETTFPSLRAVIALPGRIVLGGAYLAGMSGQFRVDRDENAGAASHLRIEGSGGMNFVRISLARRLAPSFALGVDYDVITGSYREEWTRTFDDTSLVFSRDTLEVSYPKRARVRLGAVAAHRGYALGAAFEAERAVPLTATQRTAGASVTRSKGTLTLPAGVVLGGSAPLGGRSRAVAQYARAAWSRSSLASNLVDLRPAERVSIGFERKHGTEQGLPALSRIPLRLGAYYLAWPDRLPTAGALDITGGTAAVSEWGLTLGSGLRSRDREGAVDFSLEAGSRGHRDTLGAREYFVRFGISLLVSDDTWKGSFH